jgi:hypothetical protein
VLKIRTSFIIESLPLSETEQPAKWPAVAACVSTGVAPSTCKEHVSVSVETPIVIALVPLATAVRSAY